MAPPKVVFLMADYGHDPTETTGPYTAFKNAGFDVAFATENGKAPECDKKMLEGITQLLLGANKSTVSAYRTMSSSPELLHPLSWTSPGFTLTTYDLVFLPGGHDKGVRQVIDSPLVHSLVTEYFPLTRKDSNAKAIAAVCHGVMVLSEAKGPDGSPIRDCDTTALPAFFEQSAYWGTRVFLGDYYKTYGAGSDDVEVSVKRALADPGRQWKSNIGMAPFVVEDKLHNYISARFPGDVPLMAEKVVAMVKGLKQ